MSHRQAPVDVKHPSDSLVEANENDQEDEREVCGGGVDSSLWCPLAVNFWVDRMDSVEWMQLGLGQLR